MTELDIAGVKLRVGAVSDPGLKRPQNEDSCYVKGPVFVVADGMGGYEAGDVASAAVVGSFAEAVAVGDVATFESVEAALLLADERVAEIAARTDRGAGSTVCGAALVTHDDKPYWLVFNVGDSRVYRHFGAVMEQVTVDHSLGAELVAAGELAAEELATFAQKNVITRAVGSENSRADSWLVPLVNGERLLLCSDGLHGELDDDSIRATMTMTGATQRTADVLVERAKGRGGRDNITVVVVDVISGGADLFADHSASVPVEWHGDDDTVRVT